MAPYCVVVPRCSATTTLYLKPHSTAVIVSHSRPSLNHQRQEHIPFVVLRAVYTVIPFDPALPLIPHIPHPSP